MEKKQVAVRSVDTEALIKHLCDKEEGYLATYEELSKVAMRDVQKDRGPLNTARRALWAQSKYWLTVVGEGIIRATAAEALSACKDGRTRIERASRRTCTKLAKIDFEELDDKNQQVWQKEFTIMNLHRVLGKQRTIKAIESAVDTKKERLELAESIDTLKQIL